MHEKRGAGVESSRYIYAVQWIIVIECIDYVD